MDLESSNTASLQQPLASSSRHQTPLAENQTNLSPVSLGKKRSLLDGISHNEESPSSPGPISIKRRLVRPKKIRQSHGDVSPPTSEDLQMRQKPLDGAEPEPLKLASSLSPSRQSSKTPSRHPSPSVSTPFFADALLPPPPRSMFAPLRSAHPPLVSCRSVYNYTRLNHIEEGTYGVVFRARCNDTGEIYALKKLKLDEEKQGFPITSLREVMALMIAGGHENVVGIREIVVGDTLNQVFIVMPFIEHDLKTLLADMPHPFLQSEVKTIMLQLLSAVAHCHANWILHRDLKTSNLLMNNRGQIKVADFGLARKFGDPLGEMTQLVVTLWYRSPELLLGGKEYTTAVDIWSIGCIFAELMQGEPLFPGRGEIDQINRIFQLLGRPNDESWPGYSSLPLVQKINPIGPMFSTLRQKFKHLTYEGHNLLSSLLCYDPERRITAEEALKHPYFSEHPLPKHPDLFSSFPSQAAGERKHKSLVSPSAPVREDRMAKGSLADLDSFV
ncbi:hypothetical protein I312_101308 [Cryptococcus bacillisporus CA1280]|uniref:cyclin-dependent kinase n=1 Tax=Cryptococcus bacillisporus CA1280 TaxID=1296109 RepID=A0A0D0TPC4_CRYGA|nr:CMGC/CDK protein kinase [Cryptococcus bacillisporus CA1280]